MGMTLYDIDARIAALEARCDDAETIDEETGEIVRIDLDAELTALRMAREEKLENVACWVKNLNAYIDGAKAEEKKLADKRRAAERRAESLKAWLLAAMTHEDGTTDRLKTARASISVRRNQPSTVCDDELLPWKYKTVKQTVTPDKAAIKAAILSGEEVPGARLEYGRSVVIG